ncbi:MAG TPA: hypothetical protein PKE04_08550 [Clostridia bacterium]|nr:hypothetical protein [Clostridia bacterium]
MKKTMILVASLVLTLVLAMTAYTAVAETPVFSVSEIVLTYTDLEHSPFENCGLKIDIKRGGEGYVMFTKVTLEGAATVDYYKFDFDNGIMEKYYYVSAMGTAYYYTWDLAEGALAKIEDGNRNDSSESLKKMGRWETAAETVAGEVEALQTYFAEQYGVSIEEAYKDAAFGV